MARPVMGFLAEDGSFHETEAQADFRDAEEEIRKYCVTHTVDDNVFLDVIEALADPVYRYLNAKDRIDVEATRKETNGLVGGIDRTDNEHWTSRNYPASQGDVEGVEADQRSAEDELASLLQQPSDRHEPMPDVGSGASAEGVLEQRASDGTRSGLGDARSLRGDQALATDAEAKA